MVTPVADEVEGRFLGYDPCLLHPDQRVVPAAQELALTQEEELQLSRTQQEQHLG